ncbi:MAG: 4Fe-4S binding protein [Candidatus Ozemobacteraceae bacterium]
MPKAQIHYFSVTGNSRLAAEEVVRELEKGGWDVVLKDIRNFDIRNPTSIKPMSNPNSPTILNALNTTNTITNTPVMNAGDTVYSDLPGTADNSKTDFDDLGSVDFVGFVFPVFAFRAAIPMERHIQALPRAAKPTPVFLVATYAGYLDRAFMRLCDFLLPKNYIPVITTTLVCEDSWTAVRFPGWIFDKGKPLKKDIEGLREFSAHALPEAWKKNRESPKTAVSWVPFSPITLVAAMFPIGIWKGAHFPIFVRKSLCNRCGVCVRQCPTGRLRLSPYPVAQGNCVGCYGCINSCPKDAINTWFTNGNVRYRGPEIQNPEKK